MEFMAITAYLIENMKKRVSYCFVLVPWRTEHWATESLKMQSGQVGEAEASGLPCGFPDLHDQNSETQEFLPG